MLSTNLGGRGPDLLDIEHDLRFAFRCPALDVGILNAFFSVHETFLFALFLCATREGVTSISRYKTIIGSRTLLSQRTEASIACTIISKMTQLGMPDSYCAT